MKATYRSRGFRSRAALAFLLALAGHAAHGDPTPICVADSSELPAVLGLAEASPVTIMLVQNTYDLKGTVWNMKATSGAPVPFSGGSSLLGGYTDSTCSSRNIDINNTIVMDSTSAPSDGFDILGSTTIEGITFKLSGGLAIGASKPLDPGTQLTIRRSVFTGSTAANRRPLEIDWNESTPGGTIRIVNNLVHDNSSSGGPSDSAAMFVLLSGGKPTIEMVNNTIVDNSGSLGGFGLLNISATPVYAYNNIFYGNGATDFAIFAGATTTLVDNVIGTQDFATPNTTPFGTTTADPKLDVNFKPIEAPPSPVINSGSESVIGGLPSTDLPGRTRTVGSEPDRGAYESSINDSATQTVTTTNDSGVGSLRSAILSANALGSYTTILFDIGSSCGPQVITLATPLPNITTSLQIVGVSQPGSSLNDEQHGDDAVICVILDGATNNIGDGVMVPAGVPDATQVNIQGLAFSGFTHGAMTFYGGSGHVVQGTHIGGAVGGVNLSSVGTGVVIGPGVHDVTIGGDQNVDSIRNIIGSAIASGISIGGGNGTLGPSHDNTVINNYIGVGWDTSGDGSFNNRGNGGDGIDIAGFSSDIEYNIIEYNAGYGIHLTGVDAHDNVMYDNFIGYLYSITDVGSGNLSGVVNENDAHDNHIDFNAIYFNTGTGVRIVTGQHNEIFENQIFGNGGLGIDLAGAGVTPNDNDSDSQAPDYANAGINFPVVTGAIGGHLKGTFTGSLTTVPGIYYIDLFASPSCDSSGHGEGQFELNHIRVDSTGSTQTNGQATVAFSVQNAFPTSFGLFSSITATAIDVNNNTSEFSACFPYHDDTLFEDGFEPE